MITQRGAVSTITVDGIKAGWEQWILLQSDVHFDSVQCDRELFAEHLQEAKRRNAWVMIAGDLFDAKNFLADVGVDWRKAWSEADTEVAFAGWNRHVTRRPIADVQIGGFALRFDGLLTRNAGDFRAAFPNLKILEP